MIMVLACTCGGVESLARTVLKDGGDPNWLNHEIHQGRSEAVRALETIEPQFGNTLQYKALHDKLAKGSGKYVIILGYSDDGRIRWGDIGRGKIEEVADAEIIVSEFL